MEKLDTIIDKGLAWILGYMFLIIMTCFGIQKFMYVANDKMVGLIAVLGILLLLLALKVISILERAWESGKEYKSNQFKK